MPDIVEVHGAVGEVADLPTPEFEGRVFWVQGTDAGLYRDNGVDNWDRVSVSGGGGGLTDPMTTDGDIIVRAAGVADRMPKGGNNTIFGVDIDGTLGYQQWSRGFTRRLEVPPSSGWTSLSGTGAFYSEKTWVVQTTEAASDILRARVRAATASATRQYFNFIVPNWFPQGDIEAGICLNDSASGNFISLTIGWDNAGNAAAARVTYWTDQNTIDSVASEVPIYPGPAALFIVETSGSRGYYLASGNEPNVGLQIHSDSLSDFMNTRADRVGFCWNPKSGLSTRNIGFTMPHWHAD